ncbi:hypothetical protein [Polyangium mundeleinium]|uniref:Outer membrane protein beta-barrel domain-containing protein n=1 Tax=Polyangium mundeleinium TaxID=2995306 RepID=A0ABT5F5W4_9BACT|nr:hypothetical protein [Polyangium mundeleinium]MDC0749488.1 hypothetical protein [Polyangium mundeleinium]
MAKVVSPKKVAALSVALTCAITSWASPSSAQQGPRGGRSTTEAQAEAKKEEAGVRTLGTSGLEDEKDPTLRAVTSERRSSFTFGLAIGASLGSASGFPNDPTKIGLLRYYTDTGIGAGFGARAWAGAALRDFLSFGLTFGAVGLDAGDKVFFSGMVGFHTEIFPLYTLGGSLRDLGLMVETGVGTAIVTPADDQDTLLVDGGLTSALGLGVFYEGFRLGSKVGMGPYLAYDYMYGTSIRGGAFVLGWRTALYPRHK